jgi:uncharacterized protein
VARLRLTRRRVLGCCGGLLAAGTFDAFVVEPRWLSVTRRAISIPGLPASLDGLRIAHLSDLHLSELGSIHERVVSELERFSPELTAITGDSVEGVEALPVLRELAREVRRVSGEVLATPGNWEHWGSVPVEDLAAAYADGGARLLVNEATHAAGLVVVGIDDSCSGNADARAATQRVRVDPASSLVLTHAPGLFDELDASLPRFALGLAGHTHGGQICALGESVFVPPGSGRFVEGLYETALGPIAVSRGIGMSVIGARLTCRPELVLLTLHRA